MLIKLLFMVYFYVFPQNFSWLFGTCLLAMLRELWQTCKFCETENNLKQRHLKPKSKLQTNYRRTLTLHNWIWMLQSVMR